MNAPVYRDIPLPSEARGSLPPRHAHGPRIAAAMAIAVIAVLLGCSRSAPTPSPPEVATTAPAGDVAVTMPAVPPSTPDESTPPKDAAAAAMVEEPVEHQLTVEELRGDPRLGPLVALFPDILVEVATGGAVLSLPNQPVNFPPSEAAALRRTLKDEVLPALEAARIASKGLRDQFGAPSFLPRSSRTYMPADVPGSLQKVVRHDWEIASDSGAEIPPALWKRLDALQGEPGDAHRSRPFGVVDANGNIRKPVEWQDPVPFLTQVRESTHTATLIYDELFAVCHLLKSAADDVAVDRALVARVTDLVNDTPPPDRVSTVTFLAMNFQAREESQWDQHLRELFDQQSGTKARLFEDLLNERVDRLAHLFTTWDTTAEAAQRSLHAAWASMQTLLKAGDASQGLTLAPLTDPLPILTPLAVDGLARDRLMVHPAAQENDNGPLRNNTLLPVATRRLPPRDTDDLPTEYIGFFRAPGGIVNGGVTLDLHLHIDQVRHGTLALATSDRRIYLGGQSEYGTSPNSPTTLLCVDVVSGTLRIHNANTTDSYFGGQRSWYDIKSGATTDTPVVGFFYGSNVSLHRASPDLIESLKDPSVLTKMLAEPLLSPNLKLKQTDQRFPDVAYLMGDAQSLLLQGNVTPEIRLRGETFDLRPTVRSP